MKNRVPLFTKIASNEEGFVIPIAVGMGLIMILLATTAIVKSQDDRVTSINKKDTARSLLAAEAGVAQIQSFMNQYRAVASYPACVGSWNSDGTCSDPNTEISWAVAANLPNLNTVCSTEPVLATARETVQGTTTTEGWANAKWKKVDPTDTTTDPTRQKGEFRLLEYKEGTLTVEGRVNAGQSNEALSQLKVTVPVFETGTQRVAPLWVTGSVSGSPQINGDVMGTCSSTLTATFPAGTDHKNITSRLARPSVDASSTGATSLNKISEVEGQNLPRIEMETVTDPITGNPRRQPKLYPDSLDVDPTTGYPKLKTKIIDSPDANGVYKYIVTSFDGDFAVPGAGSTFDANDTRPSDIKVQIWVTGDLNLSDRKIVNQCAGRDSCTPLDVGIYGTSSSGTLTLNPATRICDVFFHMPNYDVVSSTSSATNTTQDCGAGTKNTGIYWVKSWTASGDGTAIDSPRIRWSNPDVSGIMPTLPPPRIGPIKTWKPQQSG
jgi:Tfp pilus assembly protein PilX